VKGNDKDNNGEEDEVDTIIVDLKNQLHTERIEHIARVEALDKANHERNMALIKVNHQRDMAQIKIEVGDAQIQIRKICARLTAALVTLVYYCLLDFRATLLTYCAVLCS
jgi:hypothetical protein